MVSTGENSTTELTIFWASVGAVVVVTPEAEVVVTGALKNITLLWTVLAEMAEVVVPVAAQWMPELIL